MNKGELVVAMAQKSGLTKADAKKALEAFTDAIGEALKKGDKVNLIGFGTFSVYERQERTGINPATKNKIVIPARKVVKFKPGIGLSSVIE